METKTIFCLSISKNFLYSFVSQISIHLRLLYTPSLFFITSLYVYFSPSPSNANFVYHNLPLAFSFIQFSFPTSETTAASARREASLFIKHSAGNISFITFPRTENGIIKDGRASLMALQCFRCGCSLTASLPAKLPTHWDICGVWIGEALYGVTLVEYRAAFIANFMDKTFD